MRNQIRGLAHQDLGVEAHSDEHRAERQVMRGQLAVGREDAGGLARFQDAGDGIVDDQTPNAGVRLKNSMLTDVYLSVYCEY